MHKQPILSIIIITHEQHEQFRRCIDSLLALRISYLYEIIISDDSSTDGTFEIAQQYAKYSHHYKNLVRIVALQCNSQSCSPVNNSERSGYNRCNAYSHAQGKYIAFVDGDDYFDSNSHVYDLQIEALEEHPNCSLAMSNYYYQKDGTEETMIVKPSMELQHKEIIPDDVFITNCYFHLNQAFLQRRIQGFNPYSLYGKKWADSIITYHHLQYGPIVYVDACGYVYVQYKTSITGIMESQDRDKEIVWCLGLYVSTLIPRWRNNFIQSSYDSIRNVVHLALQGYKLSVDNYLALHSLHMWIYECFGHKLTIFEKTRLRLFLFWQKLQRKYNL